MRLLFVILATLLIPLWYSICNLRHPGVTDVDTKNLVMLVLVFMSREFKENKRHLNLEKFIYYVATGLVISDIYDRRHNNLRTFTTTDIITVAVTAFIGLRQSFPETYRMYFGEAEDFLVLKIINPIKNKVCILWKKKLRT